MKKKQRVLNVLLFVPLFSAVSVMTAFAGEVALMSRNGTFTYRVDIADTPDKWLSGLRKTDDLADNEGMLFLFPYEDVRAFTTTGMKFTIDIIYFNSSYTVIGMFHDVPPGVKVLLFPQPAYGVLERKSLQNAPKVNQGDRIKIIN
jgi:uncharacterized membrane protein (UPF0127 family)